MSMITTAKSIYLATRKRHDLLFNVWIMRPLAAVVVAALAKSRITPNQLTLLNLFVGLAGLGVLMAWPSWLGAVVAVAIIELGYLFDCADGMLARHRGIASQQGHLFDFFTDEIKALGLVSAVGVHLWRAGGWTPAGHLAAGDSVWLLAALGGAVVVASATSLTNFVRRPEMTGRETPIAAHYESVEHAAPKSAAARLGGYLMTFLQFLNHYPSHLWVFALLGALDVFFWIYVALNGLYLAKGWLGLVVRFGR